MIRSTWTDINPEWVDYLEARVEAMDEYIKGLELLVEKLERERMERRDTGYGQMPCLLV